MRSSLQQHIDMLYLAEINFFADVIFGIFMECFTSDFNLLTRSESANSDNDIPLIKSVMQPPLHTLGYLKGSLKNLTLADKTHGHGRNIKPPALLQICKAWGELYFMCKKH